MSMRDDLLDDLPDPGLDDEPARGRRTAHPHERVSKSVRLDSFEWTKVQTAAARTPENALVASVRGNYWMSDRPAVPLTWMRAVCVSWAEYVSALPPKRQGEMPAVALKAQADRIALLEAKLLELGVDPKGLVKADGANTAKSRRGGRS